MVPNLKLFKTRPNYVKTNNCYNIDLTYKQVRLHGFFENSCKWKVHKYKIDYNNTKNYNTEVIQNSN